MQKLAELYKPLWGDILRKNPTSSFGHRVESAFEQVPGLDLSARVHEIFRLQMPNFIWLGAEFADHRVENLIGQLKKKTL